VVWALRPGALEEGTLVDALEGLVRDFRSETGLDAASRVGREPRRLDPATDAALLRVAQEALANVRKHARARTVALTLTYLDDAVRLDVRDDGVGFEPGLDRDRDPWHASGFGLTGMRERLEQQGGALTVESAPGKGTTVAAALPDVPARPANDEGDRRAGMGATTGAR
jgi:signal transduction histidine kinase